MDSPLRVSRDAPFFCLDGVAWPLFSQSSRAVAEACLFSWPASRWSSTPDHGEDAVLAPDGID